MTLGEIELKKTNPFIEQMNPRIGISPLLQSHILEFANELPFDRTMALLHTALPAVRMSSSQSQRLTQHIGNLSALEEVLGVSDKVCRTSNQTSCILGQER